jgi:hypothetical protein
MLKQTFNGAVGLALLSLSLVCGEFAKSSSNPAVGVNGPAAGVTSAPSFSV